MKTGKSGTPDGRNLVLAVTVMVTPLGVSWRMLNFRSCQTKSWLDSNSLENLSTATGPTKVS